MNLRPYQLEAINSLTYSRDLIYLATGAGKGVLIKEVARIAISQGKKVCFIVYGKSIVEQQARKHFSQITNSISVVMGQNKYRSNQSIYCCSISTLSRNVELASRLLNECDLFLVDEAHHATSESYEILLNAIPSHKPVIGFSATPFHVGKKGHTFWSNVIHPVTTKDLIDEGFLVNPVVNGPPEVMVSKKIKTTA